MTDAGTTPPRPVAGQRWRFEGQTKESTWQVVDPKDWSHRVVLRKVHGDIAKGELRYVEWARLVMAYTYLGDFSVPEGYSVHKIEMGPGGHCFKTPAGNVHGGTQMEPWTWKQARDAAAEHSRRTS